MKKIYAGIIILLLPLSVFGFRGVGFLIWENDTIRIISNPLSQRTDYDSLSVKIIDKIEKAIYPEELLFSGFSHYHAEWILQNDSLFLNNINTYYDVEISLNDIFPDIGKNQKLFADWVNGELHSPQGKTLVQGSTIHSSLLEREMVFTFENGLLKNYELFHNQVVRMVDSNFYRFAHRNINWDIIPDLADRIILVYIGVQPNEQGQFENIIEEYTFLMEFPVNNDDFIITDLNNIFIQEGIRIAKLISDWEVIYQRGKIVVNSLVIELSERNRQRFARE